ncbi:MAG TPA: hypothetical protein VMS29_08965 [Pyrinomonadaceae bacterium]|nr:hypothetical protein [Pyrinomonadaceae bacterium]
MPDKEKHNGPGPKTGPREDKSNTTDSWSRDTGTETISELSDTIDDRLAQMSHGDESAGTERTTEKPASADFFEPLDADRGEDARRAEGA